MISTDYDNSLFPGQIFCILNTMDYRQKVMAHLNDPAHKIVAKDAMQSMEYEINLLIKKKSSLLEYVTQQLLPHGLALPRLYGLPKMHKEGIILRPIINTIWALTYCFAKHLLGLLEPCLGYSPHHVKNPKEFFHTVDTLDDPY
jgi:hypothetical protein